MEKIISILTLAVFMSSCVVEDIGKEQVSEQETAVQFFIESIDTDSVKSSIDASETVVKDINI